jgi:hypothetical protein
MPSETVLTNHQDPGRELPPVQAPSGRFIVQLFLVPGLIVTVAVLILLGFSWLVGGDSEPEKLLERLESRNADVRWRAANEIAQRLTRDDQLAANPRFGLRLASLLRKVCDEMDDRTQGVSSSSSQTNRQGLLEKRKDIQFLVPCLGNLTIPIGVPLLNDIALKGKSSDPKTIALLRRDAVWGLANLAQNLSRYDRLSESQKADVVAVLKAAAYGPGPEADWARLSLEYLEGKRTNLGVVEVLAECAKADEPYLRWFVAVALTFWGTDGPEKALAEKTLHMLSFDDGRGVPVEIGEGD